MIVLITTVMEWSMNELPCHTSKIVMEMGIEQEMQFRHVQMEVVLS